MICSSCAPMAISFTIPDDIVIIRKVYFEVNCLDLSYRYIKDFYYKEPMGNGEYTIFDEIGEWENNTKGSIGEDAREFVCNYK